MAREFEADPGSFSMFGLEEYLDLMVQMIERLNPDFVVERIAGEVNPGYLLSEPWGLRYDQVLKQFEQILARRDTWQGKKFSNKEA